MSFQFAQRYHDFSYGHRVDGHESKCALLHGHNGRAEFICYAPALDEVGRVIDFGVIKTTLCQWLEDNWDHKFLAFEDDLIMQNIHAQYHGHAGRLSTVMADAKDTLRKSIVWTPFNPTAENMASYLLNDIGPLLLPRPVKLVEVRLWETRKCAAIARLT